MEAPGLVLTDDRKFIEEKRRRIPIQ